MLRSDLISVLKSNLISVLKHDLISVLRSDLISVLSSDRSDESWTAHHQPPEVNFENDDLPCKASKAGPGALRRVIFPSLPTIQLTNPATVQLCTVQKCTTVLPEQPRRSILSSLPTVKSNLRLYKSVHLHNPHSLAGALTNARFSANPGPSTLNLENEIGNTKLETPAERLHSDPANADFLPWFSSYGYLHHASPQRHDIMMPRHVRLQGVGLRA